MATYYILLVHSFTLLLLSTFCFCGISLTEAFNSGFSLELIHRDSSKSPFYNPTETPFQRLTNAFHRSMGRINRFYPNAKVSQNEEPQADIISNHGEYLMRYSIGTPPVEIFGIADTGSDLIWSQCKPCEDCYNQAKPMFDPSKSTTYTTIPCVSKLCLSLGPGQSSCGSTDQSACGYSMSYGDGSYSSGDLALDTLTLGSTTGRPVSFPKIPIGCGHNNQGTFESNTSGIVGLGGGTFSLISQIGTSIGSKFSYCLVPFFDSQQTASKLNFGQNADVSGAGVVSTPIVAGPVDTFYYLTLEGMSVGDKRLDFVRSSNSTSAVEEGNIIIDSGTTLTLLPDEFYTKLEAEVAAMISLVRTKGKELSLCYQSPPNTIKAPSITAHFSGADVELSTENTFVSVSDDVVCFAFASAESAGAIFGNLAQANFLVGYDLQKKTVSFKPTQCSKM